MSKTSKTKVAKKESRERGERAEARLARGELVWALGLTLLAWIHRLAFLASNRDRDWPFTVFYEGDAETFFRHARAFLDGRLYDNGVPFHPPGFPAFLALVHTLLGAGRGVGEIPHFAVKTVLALVGAAGVGLLFLLVRPYLGRTAALLAALLATYHFGLYVLAIATVGEGLYLTLLLAVLLVWSRGLEHPLNAPGAVVRRPVLAGIAVGVGLGLATLVRAETPLVAALLLGVGALGWARGGLRRERLPALAPWLLAGLAAVAVVAPWTVRNAVRLGELNERFADQLAEPFPTFVPVTIYGPLNLALANQDDADGSFSPAALTARTGGDQLDFRDPEHLRWLLHGDAIAWEWIRSHPAAFARLALKKWALVAGALDLGFTQWDWPGGLVGNRRPVDVFVPDSRALRFVLAPLVLLGLGLALARAGGPRRFALLVVLLAGATFFVTALFYGYARLGLLVLPFGLALVAWAPLEVLRRAGREVGDKPPRRLLAVLAGLAVLLLALELHGAGADRNYRASASTIDGRILNRDDTVRLEVLPPER